MFKKHCFKDMTQLKIITITKRFCKDLDNKLVFTPSNIKKLFGVKDPIPTGLRSRVIYKFTCAGCSARYVGGTNSLLSTRIREHLSSDKNSHISKLLASSDTCRTCLVIALKFLTRLPQVFNSCSRSGKSCIFNRNNQNPTTPRNNLGTPLKRNTGRQKNRQT